MRLRTLIATAVACALAAVSFVVLPGLDASSWRAAFSPRLLEPTGSQVVGVRRFRVATGAADPWRPGHARVVMVDVHYPALAGRNTLEHHPRAQYMTEQAMLAWAPDHEKRVGLREGEVNWMFRTHAHEWAPPSAGRYPVVVMSAPRGGIRTSLTTLAEELASHGHVVVTVDHPYDAPAVELWQTRRVIVPADATRELSGDEAASARAADLGAVAHRLPRIDDELINPTESDPLFGETLRPGCVVVIAGRLRRALAGLTDEPMIRAQLAAHFPRVDSALASQRSLVQAGHDFRTRSVAFREAVKGRLADEPARCYGR